MSLEVSIARNGQHRPESVRQPNSTHEVNESWISLQHIKSVLSGVFSYAKNEGAYDGFNPVQGAMIPGKAREPEGTYAYNIVQILRILQILPLFPKAIVATASLAGLRGGRPTRAGMAGLHRRGYCGQPFGLEGRCEPTANSHQPAARTCNP
jgi:hypothetical protein